jgi:hypothetical protein
VNPIEAGTFRHHTWPWTGNLTVTNPGQGAYIKVARFSPEQLVSMKVAGGMLTNVSFLAFSGGGSNTTTAQLRIWLVNPLSTPENPVYTHQNLVANHASSVNTFHVDLQTPISIPNDKELWIGVHMTPSGNHNSGALDNTAGSVVEGFGNVIWRQATGWTTLSNVNGSDRNWIIEGYADIPSGRRVALNTGEEIRAVDGARGLLGYRVSRDGTLLTPTTVPVLTFTENNVPFGTHTYNVTAYFSDGESSPASVQVNVSPVFNPPQNLQATAGDEVVNLTWQIPAIGSTGTVVGYRVYRGGTAITETITGLSYSDTDVVNNTTYTYFVRAIFTDLVGESAPSNNVTATPRPPVFNPPRSLQALAGNQVVNLTWQAPVAGSTGTLSGYRVYRDGEAVTGTITGTSYRDEGLTNMTTYTYFVKAIYTNPVGESVPSNTVSAIPNDIVLHPPRNLTNEVNGRRVVLNWEEPEVSEVRGCPEYGAIPALLGYRVYRGTVLLTQNHIDALTFAENNVPFGVHTYSVVAVYTSGDSVPATTIAEIVNPAISINPSFHDFGTVLLKQSSSQEFTITNIGDGSLVVNMIELHSAETEFMINHLINFPVSIDANESINFSVTFTPISEGEKSAELLINHNVDGSPSVVLLTGEGEDDVFGFDDVVEMYGTVLIGNFPNPFNPYTSIRYQVSGINASVRIEVFDMRGRLVRTLLDGSQTFGTGVYSVVWDGRDDNGNAVSSGIYLYRMVAGDYVEVRRMVLMK